MKNRILKITLLCLLAIVNINVYAGNITFADPSVKYICAVNWDTNRDGELSIVEAAAVTDLGSVFESKSYITSFNELQYFTGLTRIGPSAFYGCSGLTSVTIPNSVTDIWDGAFLNCYGLTAISIPNSVTGIGDWAFRGCSITTVNIPNSVTYIGENPFACSSLKSITVASGNSKYDSRNNCNAIIETSSNTLISGCKNTVIPNSVTSIGTSAFSGCSSLTSVTIPNSVTSIGFMAFYWCETLTSITIPSNVTSIGASAFSGCSSLTSVTVENPTPLSITRDVFSNRANATLYVPAGSKNAYLAADYWKEFKNIIEMTSSPTITFADANVKAICAKWDANGDGELSEAEAAAVTDLGSAFTSNKNITSFNELQYFTGLTSIGNYAFYGCSKLASITIPSSVTSIGDNAFNSCSTLTSVTIPNSVTSIGETAFFNSGLNTIVLGSGVTSIGQQAFTCINMASITVALGNTKYDSRNNCNAIIETSSNTLIVGCKTTVIPSTVTSIGELAFNQCSTMTSIIIPNSVTSIGRNAFWCCIGLTSITIPNSVTSIGVAAFDNCYGLTSVNLGNGVSAIGQSAFANCDILPSITIPNSVTSIGSKAFYNCSSLTSVTVENPTPLSITEDVFTNRANATLYVPAGSKNAYLAADYWKEFKNIIEMTSSPTITFADANVKAICVANWDTNHDGEISKEEAAAVTNLGTVFENNKNIITFNELQYFTGLTNIGNYAFDGCTSLTSIDIPNSVTNIGENAFSFCSSLTSITIPNSVTSINGNPFLGCPSLTSITVASGNTMYDSRDNCNAIIEIPSKALISGCKNTIIPNSVTSIGNYAFARCSGMTTITIPNCVTSIGENAFDDCTGLISVTIGKSVASIGRWAFSGSNKLISVTVENPTPISIKEDVFSNRANATLYVPAGSKNAYLAADYWKEFKNIIEIGGNIEPSNNTLYTETVEIRSGDNASISLELINEDPIVMVEFFLQLPEGINISKDEDDYWDATLNSNRSNRHNIEVEKNSDGLYHILVYSSSNKSFKGNEGELINIKIECDENVESGTYQATLRNILLNDADKNEIVLPDYNFSIHVTDVLLGDVNGDTKINGSDIVELVDFIMGRESSRFIEAAAELTGDGQINGSDLVEEISLVMSQGVSQAPVATGNYAPRLLSSGLTLKGNETGTAVLGVHADDSFIFSQMVLQLSEGQRLTDITTDEHHCVEYRQLSENTYSVLCYSSSNAIFSSNEAILAIHYTGQGTVSVKDAMMVDNDRQEWYFAPVSMGDATGIDWANQMLSQPADIYSINGYMVKQQASSLEGLAKGVYIINGNKITIK